MQSFNLAIAGAKPSNQWLEVKSPFNADVLGKVERANIAAIEQAFNNAEQNFYKLSPDWPAYQRAEILYSLARQIETNAEELALGIALEGAKPLKDARIEVRRAALTIKLCADQALAMEGRTLNMQKAAGTERHLAFTLPRPIGPVLAICAFNHPLNLACHQIGAALAAGNSIIFKPASQTPLSALRLAAYLKQAGLPDGMLNIVICSGAEIEAYLFDKRLRYVSFIGSEQVGWQIPKKVAPGVRYALEHGGTAAAIVHHDADLSRALPAILRGAFYHSGQVCVSTQLVFAHSSIYAEVLAELKKAALALKCGDPANPQTDLGPLISRSELERVKSWVQEALASGAKLECGGKELSNNCFEPTILSSVSSDMKVVNREIFGPVLCLLGYQDLPELEKFLNSSDYAFQTAMFTSNLELGLQMARKIECRGFMLNESTAFRVDWMPFGGLKHSGFGVGGIEHSIADMTEQRLVVLGMPR